MSYYLKSLPSRVLGRTWKEAKESWATNQMRNPRKALVRCPRESPQPLTVAVAFTSRTDLYKRACVGFPSPEGGGGRRRWAALGRLACGVGKTGAMLWLCEKRIPRSSSCEPSKLSSQSCWARGQGPLFSSTAPEAAPIALPKMQRPS